MAEVNEGGRLRTNDDAWGCSTLGGEERHTSVECGSSPSSPLRRRSSDLSRNDEVDSHVRLADFVVFLQGALGVSRGARERRLVCLLAAK